MGSPASSAPVERESFHLQLERWRLRAARAGAARGHDEVTVADLDEQIGEVERTLAEPGQRHVRMARLASRLGLGRAEIDLVWWVVAATTEPQVLRSAEALLGPRARKGASLALFAEVAELPPDTARDLALALACGHRLILDGLIRLVEEDVAAVSPLIPAPRLIAFLAGDDRPDPGIERIQISPARRGELLYDVPQLTALRELAEVLAPGQRVLVVVEGPPRSGRKSAIAFAAGRPVLALELERIGARGTALSTALRALRRELAIEEAVPILSDATIDRQPGSDPTAALTEFIDSVPGPVVMTTAMAALELGVHRPVVRVTWTVPDTATRRKLWQHTLAASADLADAELDLIAMRYRLGPGGITRAVASARAGKIGPTVHRLGASALITGVRHNIAEGVAGLATRVEVTQTWDDLVVSDDTMDQIKALIARLRHAHQVLELWGYREKLARGTGVAALFSGAPGTGKTMVAGLVAKELELELYQVDLSQVVSKWVGETEKQLSKVFDAAEAGHALLLFDEADALFGQRSTETRGAVDRYANMEVNFLLQRIESFGGITILTTNLDAAIDKALKRRLAGHIVFAAPDEDERAALWKRLTSTSAAPLDARLDFDDLARAFATMSGANIRNAAIAAAFYAAADGARKITMDHLMRAGRAEYRSMGHMLAERPLGKK